MSETESDKDELSVSEEQSDINITFAHLIDTLNYEQINGTDLQQYFQILLNKTSPIQPDDWFIIDSFATALTGAGKLLEALCFFEEILRQNPNFLKSYQNLENVKNQLVERWHFRMLNDAHRNAAFKYAITSAIASSAGRDNCRFLDIGTGTGLLALYAQISNPIATVIGCEDSKVMLNIAKQVFMHNGDQLDRIQLIEKYSHDLNEADLCGRVDVIATEILDCGVFGEGILQTLIHAKEQLLRPINGRIIPARVQLYIAGFESKTIAMETTVCPNASFTDLIYLKNHRLVAESGEPYDTENIRQIKDFKIITNIVKAIECNFNDLSEMKQHFDGGGEKKVRLDYERTGWLDGFVVWFALTLDEHNLIESKPASVDSCWDQSIFKLNHRFTNAEKLKYLNVTVSCKQGILTLDHYYNYTGKIFPTQPDVIRFINDATFLNKMEFDFAATVKRRHSKRFENVLDFSPFPYIGISLMKERRTEKLYCSKEAQDLICFVAMCNCLKYENIIFIDDPIDVLYIGQKFDLIILAPIDPLGCVNSSQISNYSILKLNNLTPNGLMLPHKIELYGELIASKWLDRVSRVNDAELKQLKVAELINRYATGHQLNLQHFEYERVTMSPFKIADIAMDDEFHENTIELDVKRYGDMNDSSGNVSSGINGIFYFYHISITPLAGGDVISTRRNGSYIKRACFIVNSGNNINNNNNNNNNVNNVKCENVKATVHFVQNHGVIKCSLR